MHRLRIAFDVQSARVEINIGGKNPTGTNYCRQAGGVGDAGTEGRVTAKPIDDTGSKTIQAEVLNTVEEGATLYTDEHGAYTGLEELYRHESVKHSAKEFVNHMAHTNGIESVWAVLKRSACTITARALRRYVNEFGCERRQAEPSMVLGHYQERGWQ